jgi:hypothetical protein
LKNKQKISGDISLTRIHRWQVRKACSTSLAIRRMSSKIKMRYYYIAHRSERL